MSTEYKQVPDHPRIAYAVNMAARFLEENEVRKLPIDIEAIIEKIGWQLLTFSDLTHASQYDYTIDELCEELGITSGFSVVSEECGYVIAYNDVTDSYERSLFTICHEVGHCFMKHFVNYDTHNLTKEQMQVLDVEANTFAANIIIPVPVFDSLRNTERTDNMYIFGVSKSAYNTRLLTIDRDRDVLNTDSMRSLIRQFHEFIYSCKCLDCGKAFLNDNHTDVCTHCGSSRIEWASRAEYMQRKKESKDQWFGKHKLKEGALAKREKRIQELQRSEVWHYIDVEQHSRTEHRNYIHHLEQQSWDALTEEEKIDLLDERMLEEPNERNRKRNRSKSGIGHARKKTKVGNEEKAPDSESSSRGTGLQSHPNRKDTE